MANERFPRRVRPLFRLPWIDAANVARDVDDELRFHVEMRAAELIASGLTPEAAMAEAWRLFGSPSEVRAHAVAVNAKVVRRVRVVDWIAGVAHDAHFAVRQARHAPLFTFVAVATLALGIGANTAIFSVVHRLLIAPFPFSGSDRLAWINTKDAQSNSISLSSASELDAWRARAHSLEAIGAARGSDVELRDGGRVETVNGGAMSASLLSLLGVHPALGRGFEPSDERIGAAPVAMLGYEEWQTRFAGRTDVIGKSITLDSISRTIVGVAPAGFVAPFASPLANEGPKRVWVPIAEGSGGLFVIGKLRRGIAIDAVNRELTAISAQTPGTDASSSASVQALREQDLYHWLRRGLLLLFASVGVVLLIACANVANLLLVRGWSRKREFAIRTALGAGRARLIRQLIAECLTIAIAGGAVGVALAWAAIRVFIKLRPQSLEIFDRVRIEPAVLGWTMLITLGTGLAFGMVPALFATARGMTDGLKAGARDAEGGRGARVFRSSIIVAELALSVALLVSAGLLVRSFRAMEAVDLGFTPRGLSSVTVRVGRGVAPQLRRPMLAAFLQRLRQTPGIQSAGFATSMPPQIGAGGLRIQREDRPESEPGQFELAGSIAVQPGFFKSAGIRVRGRTFSADSTGMDSLPPTEVVINERFGQRLWPNEDAVGRRVRIGKTINTVVGVANDVTIPGESGDQVELQWYHPWSRLNGPSATVVIRSDLRDVVLDSALRVALASVGPQLSAPRNARSDEELRVMLAPMKFAVALVSGLAVIAVCLSIVGLYGVIAYAVSQRTREIGVRIALGALPRDIARLVLLRGGALVAAGLVVGIALSIASSRLLNAYLWGVSERDPITYAAIVALLGACALVAAYLPARRAMQVDPVVALISD